MFRYSLATFLVFSSISFCAELVVPKGFVALFNGTDLNGWIGMPHFNPYELQKKTDEEAKKLLAQWTADAKKHWHAEQGELINDGQGAYLTTAKEYGDIEFKLEYKTVAKADSGIYLKCTPQIQIWDTTKEGGKWNLGADKGSGGLWNNSPGAKGKDPLALADKPFGEWNSMHIKMVGELVWVSMNGKLLVNWARLENFWDRSQPLPKKGRIQLQTHGGEIRWRNLFIKELSAEEANAELRARSDTKFEPIFDGKTFEGWTGALDNVEIVDGTIVNKKGKGGNIFTKKIYGNYHAQVEYNMPQGGNNGLAIRYPGKGQASVEAMCEVQILDDHAPKHAKLDPRQYNGSVYGMIASTKGYERPFGEWNYLEVIVNGPTIEVWLNGNRTLAGDVSKVTAFLDNKKHPGKDLPSGHFGLCGHGDPVAFRNLAIAEIKPVKK